MLYLHFVTLRQAVESRSAGPSVGAWSQAQLANCYRSTVTVPQAAAGRLQALAVPGSVTHTTSSSLAWQLSMSSLHPKSLDQLACYLARMSQWVCWYPLLNIMPVIWQ